MTNSGFVQMSGRVILLNGTSSSGKTTLAKAIQDIAPEAYQIIALDQFRDGMPERYRGLNSPRDTTGAQGLNVRSELQEKVAYTYIEFGEYGTKVLEGMRRSIASCARSGLNVIVDDMITEKEFVVDYVNVLQELNVLCVGIFCERDELVKRENTRMGRFVGTAISHADTVHRFMQYDVEIDNTHGDPREHAHTILDYEKSRTEDNAISRMWQALR